MNIPQDVLIDVGLNVAGYLISGVLAVVIYTMFDRRRDRAVSAAPATNIAPAPAIKETPDGNERRNGSVEFVRFGETASIEPTKAAKAPAESLSTQQRRNIAETIAKARGMLQAGKDSAEVKASLPISDAELALIKFELQR